MGIKVKDYIEEINHRKQAELALGKHELIIRAGDLHAKCKNQNAPSVVQCCSAMRQCMLEGDEILYDKPSKTKASMALTIRYDLQNLSTRKAMNIIKRGRPSGAKNKIQKPEQAPQVQACTQEHEEAINRCFELWAKNERVRLQEQGNVYVVDDAYGIWKIVKYRPETADLRFLHAISEIDEDTNKCSILFQDDASSRAFWNGFSDEVKERLNLTAFFVSAIGAVDQSIL